MNHRSGMDASLLHVETPGMPMHVGSLQILDLPADDAGDFYEDVKRYGAGRMHLADVFQRKLALMPFELANRSGSITKTSTSATTFAMSSCPGPARHLGAARALWGAPAFRPARPQPPAPGNRCD